MANEGLRLNILRDFFVKAIELNFLTSMPFTQAYRSFLSGSGHAQSGFALIKTPLAAAMLFGLIDELYLAEKKTFRRSGRFGIADDIANLAEWAEVKEETIVSYLLSRTDANGESR